MTKTWCVGGRHYNGSISENVYEKVNPKTKKLVDILKRCTILKLQDMCHNPKCKCQKQITFTPKQFHWKEPDLKIKRKKHLRDLKQLGINF